MLMMFSLLPPLIFLPLMPLALCHDFAYARHDAAAAYACRHDATAMLLDAMPLADDDARLMLDMPCRHDVATTSRYAMLLLMIFQFDAAFTAPV